MTEVSPLVGGSNNLINPHGLSILTAVTFVAGDLAGSGTLGLPGAVTKTGFVTPTMLAYFLETLN